MSTWPRFVLDAMLGRLARWLRLAGLDTRFDGAVEDDVLLKVALRERRILVTRDRALAQRARRLDVPVILLQEDGYMQQFIHLCAALGLEPDALPWYQRCVECNHRIVTVDRDRVRHLVPLRIYRKFRKLYHCEQCRRVYWPGTHYRDVERRRARLVDRVRQRMRRVKST